MSDDAKAPDVVTPAQAVELRYLDPERLHLIRHGARLRATLTDEYSVLEARVLRIFPLSSRERYLSLRNGKGEEVGIIVDPTRLDAASRAELTVELARRYVLPVVRRIVRLRERFGTVEWEVETDRGQCRFTTRSLREEVVMLPPHRYLLKDVDGNRFEVADVTALDSRSQGLLLDQI